MESISIRSFLSLPRSLSFQFSVKCAVAVSMITYCSTYVGCIFIAFTWIHRLKWIVIHGNVNLTQNYLCIWIVWWCAQLAMYIHRRIDHEWRCVRKCELCVYFFRHLHTLFIDRSGYYSICIIYYFCQFNLCEGWKGWHFFIHFRDGIPGAYLCLVLIPASQYAVLNKLN